MGSREGSTWSGEMRECDVERKVSARMELGQTGKLEGGWGTVGGGTPSLMDHDVSG